MRILIIGQGGREHALAWKLRQDPRVKEIFVAPGNGGSSLEARNVPVAVDNIEGLVNFCRQEEISLVIPGPELPLTLGIVDACHAAGIPCFGPDAYCAQLEGSKAFSKNVMKESGVPTADFAVFSNFEEASSYVRSKGAPLVIKADGLAAGKGVVVAQSVAEAIGSLEEMMINRIFEEAGATVVIEEALIGEEVSCLGFCDGERVLLLPSAQDHKAVYDGDKGPNTGGMGAYSPAPILPEARYQEIVDLVFNPVLKCMKDRGHPFKGILYAGLMMTSDGPKVLEFNVRFGDPECQPLLMRLEDKLLDLMSSCIRGNLTAAKLYCSDESAVCVVMAAEGYPGSYMKGMQISGISEAEALAPGKVKVFQAGTRVETQMEPGGQRKESLVSVGGRVLCVTALGADLKEARALAYEAVGRIDMPNSHYRTDIGQKGLCR